MTINKILNYFGLVKKSKYESLAQYSDILAKQAKAAGVNVLMDDEEVSRQKIKGITFMHGTRAVFRDNLVIGGEVIVSPFVHEVVISHNTFIPCEVNQQPAGQDKQE